MLIIKDLNVDDLISSADIAEASRHFFCPQLNSFFLCLRPAVGNQPYVIHSRPNICFRNGQLFWGNHIQIYKFGKLFGVFRKKNICRKLPSLHCLQS